MVRPPAAIGILAILLSIILPSLRTIRFASDVTECMARFRIRGVVAGSYAVDNKQQLPSMTIPYNTGKNPWDVNNGFIPALEPYGLDLPKLWYCPIQNPEHPGTMAEMKPTLFYAGGAFTLLPTSYWVPRQDQTAWFPTVGGNPGHEDGWPRSLTDRRVPKQPIWTDRVYTDTAQGANAWKSTNGHQREGVLDSANLLYADGHVETRIPDEMQMRWFGNRYHFY